ncbi:hypothetical protein N496_09075 [Clostridium botulinum A2B3 87]|uniref:hypothetical protein n=1 Tax=Clostridium botulinum TaxID=1491 RepID=UPI0004A57661|nr:hypothetical protein [Clostridium botulinum]KEI99703.1 hypothetical protein N496_09075 [Clostridium botulinum A2B3 87]
MKKFLSISLLTLLISTAFFSVNVNAAHQHNWENSRGGYFPAQYGSHIYTKKHSNGEVCNYNCNTTTIKSWYERRCTICGETYRVEEKSVTHADPHCPFY